MMNPTLALMFLRLLQAKIKTNFLKSALEVFILFYIDKINYISNLKNIFYRELS